MNYYLEKILKTQQQLGIAKTGFTQVVNNCIHSVSEAIDYDHAKDIAETLNAGLDLIKELESQIEFLKGKLKEEHTKEMTNANKG